MLSFVVTRCHSLSLAVPLVVTRCHSIYHSSGEIRRKFFLTIMNPFTVFFTDFDHKLQDSFLNKSSGLFYPKRLSETASITLFICNTLGMNILEE